MSTGATHDGARRALREVQRYLADEIAPMMAAESFGVLLRFSPSLAASAIEHWLEEQLRAPDCAASVSGYLYHAVKKLHMLSELDLLDRRAVARYLRELTRLLVARCPEHEREDLRVKLARMGDVETTLSAPIELLNRERESDEIEEDLRRPGPAKEWRRPEGPASTRTGVAKSVAKPAMASAPPVIAPALSGQRLNSFLRRLHEVRSGPRLVRDEEVAGDVLAHLLSKAAIEAGDAAQLEAFLARVPSSGVVPRFDRAMFRALGDRLPGWEIDAPGASAALGHILQGMHRIVSLAPSREEGIERYGEMVYAAIEKLNEGHLAQAVAMLDVADRLTEEKKIDPALAATVRERAQSSISLGPIRQFASAQHRHGLLRKVLRFFPDFSPESLLDNLDGEPRRETRKLMLSLLEVHGPPCRPKVVERLRRYLAGQLPDPRGFYSRNAVFLMRRIGRGAEEEDEVEIETLAEMSRPGRPFLAAREAVAALGQCTLARAERALLVCLDGFESDALAARPVYAAAESWEILDRACAALARIGSTAAVERVVRHSLRQEAALGETLARLDHLAGCDLAKCPEPLLDLADRLRRALPGKVLGVVLPSGGREPLHLVRALSGTSTQLVENLLEEIVGRYPGRDFALEAEQALGRMRAKPDAGAPAAEGIQGDLEVFGLPTLFQSLADTEATGRLVVSERNGSDRGRVLFLRGKILGCEVGRLRGLDAACQLFERPRQGAFRFERLEVDQLPRLAGEPLEVLATVLEAIRRHDELQGDIALVPDGTSLAPTATAPAFPPDEEDRELVRTVWREASSGTAPESCEGRVAADAYRVRRLYVHWVEQGALTRRRAA